MLNWQKKGPVFGQKAEFWKFGICGNPVKSLLSGEADLTIIIHQVNGILKSSFSSKINKKLYYFQIVLFCLILNFAKKGNDFKSHALLLMHLTFFKNGKLIQSYDTCATNYVSQKMVMLFKCSKNTCCIIEKLKKTKNINRRKTLKSLKQT